MRLEHIFPVIIIGAAVIGLVGAFDYARTALVGKDGQPLVRWSARRAQVWGWVGLLTCLLTLGGLFGTAFAISARDQGILERALETRYGHDFEYHGGGKGSRGHWYIDGIPSACEPFGDLPERPLMVCAGLELKEPGPSTTSG